MSGYVSCGCNDCPEVAIGEPGKALCHACEAAGCEAPGTVVGDRVGYAPPECNRPHAYCGADSNASYSGPFNLREQGFGGPDETFQAADGEVEIAGVTYCCVCGQSL